MLRPHSDGRYDLYNGGDKDMRIRAGLYAAFVACVVVAAGVIALAAHASSRQAANAAASVSSSASPTSSLATPTAGVTSQFLSKINGAAFHLEQAPAGATPAISQSDAETTARNFPPTNGVVNGSVLGECVWPGTKSYLCWLIDATSHQPVLASVPHKFGTQTTPSPGVDRVVYGEFYVIVDAESGSSTAGTIVDAGGIDGTQASPTA
jgi:hypothetical protein